MKKRTIAAVMTTALFISTLSACSAGQTTGEAITEETQEETSDGQQAQDQESESGETAETAAGDTQLGQSTATIREIGITPCVEPYTVEPDLSNIDNSWQFWYDDDVREKLVKNGFVVRAGGSAEFFEEYEQNRYLQQASFVTVDSLMHTYHLYFGHLLKNVERDYLSDRLGQLSRLMLTDSKEAYDRLKGSEWESAAKRNVAFFTIGAKLLDDNTEVEDYVKDSVQYELGRIDEREDIFESSITGEMEDYTQYIPRGYYEGDETLERYFKAMMWYGRVHFEQDKEDLDRSALLISQALSEDTQAYELWQSIYDVTAFFTGESDDADVADYLPIIREAYGENATTDTLVGNEKAFEQFHSLTAMLQIPQINSVPIGDGEDNVIPGFRFMGQRFSVDAAIMQKLIYSDVRENSAGDKRMLPDVLDVPAALGSDTALAILEENGATEYRGYSENMERLRSVLGEEDQDRWSASLYAGWLNTLRPLLEVKGEGYPMFMQGEEWAKKNLECFAGSFTELKHDTILYTKQVMAEMGGGYEEEPDDRGYVEPEPLVYVRFAELSDRTAEGLKKYGMLSAAEEENLSRLSQIADQLLTISKKELLDEVPTEEEFEFIRSYGGNIEHFWYEAVKDQADDPDQIFSEEYQAAIVVDIATDPNGTVLEAATGSPSFMDVIVKVDGKLKIARGSVYTFYQFDWPMNDRLTDAKWQTMMGMRPDEEGVYHYENKPVKQPAWTDSYRYRYEWE